MGGPRAALRRWLPLPGVLPVTRQGLAADALAGLTLAALGIPEVLGYARIAGMPVVTGLYTLLLPMAAFAVLGSSRHLVVAADSATAAIMAATLTGLAAAGSPRYVQLAGLAALMAGGLLALARLARLGFLANFLSRTVLLGFLAGVGVQVAVSQLPDMLGVSVQPTGTVRRLVAVARALPDARPLTIAVSAAVIAAMLIGRRLTSKIPSALIAVVAAIAVSWLARLSAHGVAVLGPVPHGLPALALPAFGLHDVRALLGAAASMFVVILAQSAATSRAYAAKYGETSFSEDTDLLGLAAANIAAAFSSTFAVNGSPTKTQMVDGAGGRSQLAQLTTTAVVLVVLLVVTGPLAYLPIAVLAAVVFLIAAELVDVPGLRRILTVRRDEFAVAMLAALAVIVLGVQEGIVLAVVVSIIDHLRHSYRPRSSVLVKSASGHWQAGPVQPGARTEDGLIVYRFGTSLYYANASRLADDLTMLVSAGGPVRWLVLDGAAIGDVDYTAAAVLSRVIGRLTERGIVLAAASLLQPVRDQLSRYGIRVGHGLAACYDTPGEALEAFHAARDQADPRGHGAPRSTDPHGTDPRATDPR
jgi:sulfate permease, SulP family